MPPDAAVNVDTASTDAADGYRITRSYYDPDTGAGIAEHVLRQGQWVLVVIQGASTRNARLQKVLVVDLLPAGLEIENAELEGAGELGLVPVIGRPSATDYTSARDDRFVAALTLGSNAKFQLAYLARAVTPGDYAAPGVMVEDMVAPRFQARSAATTLSVRAVSRATDNRATPQPTTSLQAPSAHAQRAQARRPRTPSKQTQHGRAQRR